MEDNLKDLLPLNWKKDIDEYLNYDIPKFDIGGYVVGNDIKTAELFMKTSGIICGQPFFNYIFEKLNCKIDWLRKEGEYCSIEDAKYGKIIIAYVIGPSKNILQGERTALNIISRASGVATAGYNINQKIKPLKWSGSIGGTRKTTPGFSLIEKYSLIVGGCVTHRMDLSSMVMLKDNHIWSAGNITKCVTKAKKIASFTTKIEVECSNKKDAIEAIEAGADIIMLDNFKCTELKVIAQELKQKYPSIILEASGGINEDTINNYITNDIDIISMGKLTHGYSVLDYSLKIKN